MFESDGEEDPREGDNTGGAAAPELEVEWVTNARQAISEATADLRAQVATLAEQVANLARTAAPQADPPSSSTAPQADPPQTAPPQAPQADPPPVNAGARPRLTRRAEYRRPPRQ